jgi:hypothetical protein
MEAHHTARFFAIAENLLTPIRIDETNRPLANEPPQQNPEQHANPLPE